MYRINRRVGMTSEERAARKIGVILSDFGLDLEAVGYHLAHSNPYVVYSRAIEVLDSARYNKDVAEYYQQGGYYDDRLF
ncbi:MAG: hypothetical protein EBY03_05920 [Actinobacteria bacterium]|nr:hypothetical protein [Actinomycetota bacterium]NDH99861.1 hypothetical protein [Actinomycetota bacterium]